MGRLSTTTSCGALRFVRRIPIARRASFLTLFLVAVVGTARAQAPRPFPEPSTGKAAPTYDSPFPFSPRWSLDFQDTLGAPPAFDETHAYVSLASGQLAAVRLDSGTFVWATEMPPLVAPVAAGGLLFVTQDGLITALDPATGAVRWRAPLAGKPASPPAWRNGWLIVSLEAGDLVALRATDGTIVWRQHLGAPIRTRPAILADRVYAPLEDGRVLALSIESGATLWQRKLGDRAAEALAIGDRVYVGSRDNFFYCLLAKNGRIDWRWRAGADVLGAPVADDERVYFVALDNVVRALDRNSGVLRWSKPLATRPGGGPQIAGDALLVAGRGPDIVAFLRRDGAPAGRFTVAASELSAPPHFDRGPSMPSTPSAPPGAPIASTSSMDRARLYLLTATESVPLRLVALRHGFEPALTPFVELPGTAVAPDPAPAPAIEPSLTPLVDLPGAARSGLP